SRHLALLVWAAGAGGLLATGLALLALHSLALGARQRELGLQRALGASVYGLFRQLAAEAALLAAASLALGLSAGWALSRWSEARAGMAPRFDSSQALQVLAIALGFELAAALLPAATPAGCSPKSAGAMTELGEQGLGGIRQRHLAVEDLLRGRILIEPLVAVVILLDDAALDGDAAEQALAAGVGQHLGLHHQIGLGVGVAA